MQPFFWILINLLVITTILNAIVKTFDKDADPESIAKINKNILTGIFPLLMPIGIVISSGLYCLTQVKDREDGCRYLLNFAGMGSPAYFLGLFFGDYVIFTFP